ncbi:unnamed protein product, partial [Oppiella nova]
MSCCPCGRPLDPKDHMNGNRHEMTEECLNRMNMNPVVVLRRLDTKYYFRRRRPIDYFENRVDHSSQWVRRPTPHKNQIHVDLRGRCPAVIKLTVKSRPSVHRNHRVVVNVFHKTVDE